MPVIYQGQCASCGYESPTISEGYGAIVVDDPSAVAEYAAHPDDDQLVVLGHPLELHILEEHGHTFTSATLAGRYVQVSEYFCKSCGRTYETRKLGADRAVFGCLPAIAVATVAGFGVAIHRSDVSDGASAGLFAVLLTQGFIVWGVGLAVRIRYRNPARRHRRYRRCPNCGSRRVAVPSLTWRALPCPGCLGRSMKVKAVGMS